jgi:hypothetical protein
MIPYEIARKFRYLSGDVLDRNVLVLEEVCHPLLERLVWRQSRLTSQREYFSQRERARND